MKLQRAIAAATRGLVRALPRAFAGALACVGAASAAQAQELKPEVVPSAVIQAPLDTAVGLRADGPVGKVVVSQPETVQVGLAGPDGVYLIGSQYGTTNLLIYDREGRLSQTMDVRVGYDAQALRDLLADALPGEAITVRQLSNNLLIEGEVSTPSVAAIAERLAQQVAPDGVVSRLHARASQVLLDVKIMEVSDRSLREISGAISITNGPELSLSLGGGGIGAEAPHGVAQVRGGSGRVQLDATLRALEEKGRLHIVAQPSLVALSGEKAEFRAGGEIPFPMPADIGKVTIQFRPYGAAMNFTPVVQENGTIRVALEAELSDLDPSVSLRVNGLLVPGLKVRRATTSVDLRDGEPFLIAGLFEDSSERTTREPPFLGRIPVLGKILSPVFQAVRKSEPRRELAILVTPHLSGQVTSPLGERSLLAEASPPPPVQADVDPPRTPKSASAPRGPPLRALVAEVRDALRPPVRWAKMAASRFTAALLGRA